MPPRTEAWSPGEPVVPSPPRTEAWDGASDADAPRPARPDDQAWDGVPAGPPRTEAWNPGTAPKTAAWDPGEDVAPIVPRPDAWVAGKDVIPPSGQNVVSESRSEASNATDSAQRAAGWGEKDDDAAPATSRRGEGWDGPDDDPGIAHRAEGWTGPAEAVAPAPRPRSEAWDGDATQWHDASTEWDDEPEDGPQPRDPGTSTVGADADWDEPEVGAQSRVPGASAVGADADWDEVGAQSSVPGTSAVGADADWDESEVGARSRVPGAAPVPQEAGASADAESSSRPHDAATAARDDEPSDDDADATWFHDTAAEAALDDETGEGAAEASDLDEDATMSHDARADRDDTAQDAGADQDEDATKAHDVSEEWDDATAARGAAHDGADHDDATQAHSAGQDEDATMAHDAREDWDDEPEYGDTQPHDTASEAALDDSGTGEAGHGTETGERRRGSGTSNVEIRPWQAVRVDAATPDPGLSQERRRPAYEDATMLDSGTSQPVPGRPAYDATMLDAGDDPGRRPAHDATVFDSGTSQPLSQGRPAQDATMLDQEPAGDDTMLDPGPPPVVPLSPQATYIDRMDGTRADGWSVPIVAPVPVPPKPQQPPRTRMIEQVAPAEPPGPPGTRIMSGAMLGAPMPERPVEQIAPPPPPVPMPEVAERFGIRFVSGAGDASRLLDGLHRDAKAMGTDAEVMAARTPALLIVGAPHCGQRRLTRLIARTLAGAGAGDGSVRTADASDLRGNPVQAVAATLRRDGPPLLFERLDQAVLGAPEPTRVVETVLNAREDDIGRTALIATCGTEQYERLRRDYPDFVAAFTVFRLPDMSDLETRLALIHVLADERRVTLTAGALDLVRADLPRMGGRDGLVGARLVEAYLDRAVARHTDRAGATRDRLLLTPEDFGGVAEEIEPSLRPPGDVDGFVRTLHEMIGLEQVKRTVDGLVAEARMAADRATRGLPSGNPSRHLIFLGRPGTGRTTVAGLIGGIYAALNLLDSGHLVVCNARSLAGQDSAAKIAAQVDRASGGVLLIEDAYLLDRMSAVVAELTRLMEERRDKFMVVCSSFPDEMEGFLLANPGFRAEFGAIVEFEEPTDRQLVQLFTRLAERDLYMLDEELRVELLGRFGELRRSRDFAFADTVRRLFDQIVARQSARLAGSRVNAAAVARLSVHDLPA